MVIGKVSQNTDTWIFPRLVIAHTLNSTVCQYPEQQQCLQGEEIAVAVCFRVPPGKINWQALVSTIF